MIKRNEIRKLLLLSYVFFSGFYAEAWAETEWAFGLGLGHVHSNSYIGSSDTLSITAPIPYIKIKTSWFDMSEGNMNLSGFEQSPFGLSFNFGVNLPVDSDDVELREGMPDLGALFHVGPMLTYKIAHDEQTNWVLELPATAAYELKDGDAKYSGWSFTPRIAMTRKLNINHHPLELDVSFGPVFTSRDYNQFYYQVDPVYATPMRTAYSAEKGFSGYRLNIGMSHRVDDVWFGFYMRYHDLSDAVFVDSPLVDQKSYWLVSFGMSWIFSGDLK